MEVGLKKTILLQTGGTLKRLKLFYLCSSIYTLVAIVVFWHESFLAHIMDPR